MLVNHRVEIKHLRDLSNIYNYKKMDNNLKEKYKDQTNDLYRAYGYFAIEFEVLCHNIKECIIFSLHSNGLQNQEFIRILLADQTAGPLISKLTGFIAIVYRDSKSEFDYLAPLFKFCKDINEKRNEIIHATWHIGWASDEQTEFNIASWSKDKITKEGICFNCNRWEAKMFDELTEKIKTASEILNRLLGCIVGNCLPTKNISSEALKKLKM